MLYLTYAEFPNGVYQGQVIDVCRHLGEMRGKPVRLVALISLRHYFSGRRIIRDAYKQSIVLPMVPTKRLWQLNILLLLPVFILFWRRPVMCRGVFSTLLAIMGRQIGLVRRVIYDGRGAVAAELQEYNVTPDPAIISRISEWERRAVLEADFRNAVSTKLVDYWRTLGYQKNQHVIVPCTISDPFEQIARRQALEPPSGVSSPAKFVYSGSVAGWQGIDQICALLDQLLAGDQGSSALFCCREHDGIEKLTAKYPGRVERRWVSPEEVPNELASADVGLLIRDNSVTNQVAAPTKFAEYLACGLKVLISQQIGDYSRFVTGEQCGAVVNSTSPDLSDVWSQLAAEANPSSVCLQHFSRQSPAVDQAYQKLLQDTGQHPAVKDPHSTRRDGI